MSQGRDNVVFRGCLIAGVSVWPDGSLHGGEPFIQVFACRQLAWFQVVAAVHRRQQTIQVPLRLCLSTFEGDGFLPAVRVKAQLPSAFALLANGSFHGFTSFRNRPTTAGLR